MSRNHEKNNGKVAQAFTMIMQFGINMVVPIFLCSFLGIYIGEKLHQPIIMIPFFIVGALAGFTNIFRMAKNIYGEKKDGNESDDQNTKKNK
ncbi:MAG: AtpZ/AtpI family protein [Lachnospiraceae bacterium]